MIKGVAFACKQINMFIEGKSEDSIFIMNDNINYCISDEKYSWKHIYIVYFPCMYVLEMTKKKKRRKYFNEAKGAGNFIM